MAVAFTVHAGSEEECAAGLAWLCERDGVVPTLRPVQIAERWIARAVADPAADDHSAKCR